LCFLSFVLGKSFTTVYCLQCARRFRVYIIMPTLGLCTVSLYLLLFSTRRCRIVTIYLYNVTAAVDNDKVVGKLQIENCKKKNTKRNENNVNACIIVYTMFLITLQKVVIKFNRARGGKESAAATVYIQTHLYIYYYYIRIPYI